MEEDLSEPTWKIWRDRALNAEKRCTELVTERNIKDRAIRILITSGRITEENWQQSLELADVRS